MKICWDRECSSAEYWISYLQYFFIIGCCLFLPVTQVPLPVKKTNKEASSVSADQPVTQTVTSVQPIPSGNKVNGPTDSKPLKKKEKKEKAQKGLFWQCGEWLLFFMTIQSINIFGKMKNTFFYLVY